MLINVIKNSNLPDDFLNTLPETCIHCGNELEISESLMQLECKNTKCKGKVINKLFKMLTHLGVDYITMEDCKTFIDKYKLDNHFTIFEYFPESDGELFSGFGSEKSNALYRTLSKHKNSLSLYDYVKLAYMPNIMGYEKYLFNEYENIDNFYDVLYSNQVKFIDNLIKTRGIKGFISTDEGISIKAFKIYRELVDYESFLKQHSKLFRFNKSKVTIRIGIIGNLEDTRVKEIKDKFNSEYIWVEISSTVDRDTTFVLDLEGVTQDEVLYKLYKNTNKYASIDNLELEILSYEECVNKMVEVIKLMGKNE